MYIEGDWKKMAFDDVTEVLKTDLRTIQPILFEKDGSTFTITITDLRRCEGGESLAINGVIFRDEAEWVPYEHFWPVIIVGGKERDIDAIGAVLERLF